MGYDCEAIPLCVVKTFTKSDISAMENGYGSGSYGSIDDLYITYNVSKYKHIVSIPSLFGNTTEHVVAFLDKKINYIPKGPTIDHWEIDLDQFYRHLITIRQFCIRNCNCLFYGDYSHTFKFDPTGIIVNCNCLITNNYDCHITPNCEVAKSGMIKINC